MQAGKTMDVIKVEAEIGKLIAEASKLNGETVKLQAETVKLQAESAKIARERYFYPAVVTASLIAATVTATKLFLS